MTEHTFGTYQAGSSFVHRLDPRTKLIATLVWCCISFFAQSYLGLALYAAITWFFVYCSRQKLRHIIRSAGAVLWTLGLLAILNMLLIRGGDVLVSFGILYLDTAGLAGAIIYPGRMLFAVVSAGLLLSTTTPTQLGDALDALLAPLQVLGLPAHEVAFVFSLMLRFIPTLASDAQAIVEAQAARGGRLMQGSPTQRIAALMSILIALLAQMQRHAQHTALALDARNYAGGQTRSHWHPLRYQAGDALAAASVGLASGVLIVLRFI